MNDQTPDTIPTSGLHSLYIAFELSNSKWKLALTDGRQKARYRTVDARDLTAVQAAIEWATSKLGLVDAKVMSCYEAGRDGFWLHRWLVAEGVAIVDGRVSFRAVEAVGALAAVSG